MNLEEYFEIPQHEDCDCINGVIAETKPREAMDDNGYRAFFGIVCVSCGWMEYDVV